MAAGRLDSRLAEKSNQSIIHSEGQHMGSG